MEGVFKKKKQQYMRFEKFRCGFAMKLNDTLREEEAEMGREGKGRRNVKLLHLTKDGFCSLIHYIYRVDDIW